MNDQFKYLFSPFKIGSVTVRNRICTTAHGTLFSEDRTFFVDDRYVEYQRTRAKGGVGLIIAGQFNVMPYCKGQLHVLNLWEEAAIPGVRKLAKAVQDEGAMIFGQLVHTMRETSLDFNDTHAMSPSPIPDPVLFNTVPKEMEKEDIETVINAFANAASYAKEAGLNGVEIHGASGYGVMQFMSPASNQRTDEYGGSFENRMRFPLAVIDAIREKVGNDFVLGMRITGDELVIGGNNSEDMKRIAETLASTGKIDYLLAGLPFYEALFRHGFGMHTPLGLWTPYTAGFKEVTDIPIICNFRINDPVQAEKILANGQADMVGMTRAAIADPDFPNKALQGRLDEIRACIACDQGCFGRIFNQVPMSCLQNTAVGLEKEIGSIAPATTKKKILIAGGGPAGMETARVAKMRGHDVRLYEKDNQLGGMVNVAVKAPNRDEFGGCVRYLIKQMEILGVDVHLGEAVTAEVVEREHPDAVVVATGAVLNMPDIPGIDQDNVVTVLDVLEEKVDTGENVMVIDGGEAHWQCCSTAEFLADKGKKVGIVTSNLFVGTGIASTADLAPYYYRVRPKGVTFHPNLVLTEIAGNTLKLLDIYSNQETLMENIDTVVYVARNKVNNPLYLALKGNVKEVHSVGDCLAPRFALDAIHDGYKLGRTI